MKTKDIKQQIILDCTPEEAYEAWMDSKKHGEMINGSAKIENKVGGKLTIWDGSIIGETLELHPEKNKIVQNWRYDYDDWPVDAPSKLSIEFIPHKDGCKLVFKQSDIPEKYRDEIAEGWKGYYWEPMKKYFSSLK